MRTDLALASIRFILADGRRVVIRYERTSATHGETYDAQGIFGSEGFLKWDWLPYVNNPKMITRGFHSRTTL